MLDVHSQQPHLVPLEGTDGPRRALFVKRWGTLLTMPESGLSAFHPDLLVPGATEALFRASQAGWWIYLLGNEDAVARGSLDQETWEQFESELLDHLTRHGVRIMRSYSCTDDPKRGIPGHCKESVYRLPNTGAMYHAHQAEGVELRSSWVLGDETLELAAGWRAGCLTAGVVREGEDISGPLEIDVAFVACDLASAIETLVTPVRAA